jgi:hypothetical protein
MTISVSKRKALSMVVLKFPGRIYYDITFFEDKFNLVVDIIFFKNCLGKPDTF